MEIKGSDKLKKAQIIRLNFSKQTIIDIKDGQFYSSSFSPKINFSSILAM